MRVRQFCSALILAVVVQNVAIAPQTFSSELKEEVIEKKAYTLAELRNLIHDGEMAFRTGEYQEAIAICTKALAGFETHNHFEGMGTAHNCIGISHHSLGEFTKAVRQYEQAAVVTQPLDNPRQQAAIANNLGEAYRQLGEIENAITYYEQALSMMQSSQDLQVQPILINNLGFAHMELENYALAQDYYLQSLEISSAENYQYEMSYALKNLGEVAFRQGENQKAIAYFEESLQITREIDNRRVTALNLNSLGKAYETTGQSDQALTYYQEALGITTAMGDRHSTGRVLKNLGSFFQTQGDTELAIIFLKETINTYESIRGEIQGLETSLQESYLSSVESTYRDLADLLLTQNRILEAQRVLDLLKVQELSDYLYHVRGTEETEKGTGYRPPEETFLALNQEQTEQLIIASKRLADLEKISPSNLTEIQRQELISLRKQQNAERGKFRAFLESDEVQSVIGELKSNLSTNESLSFNLSQDAKLKEQLQTIKQSGRNAAIIYPLILGDRLEIVVVSADTPPLRHTVPISPAELNETILEARQALTTPPKSYAKSSNSNASLSKLHDWLIKPIESTLETANIETLIYAPDGALRYIPLAALFDADSDQWLIEKYDINNITALSLTDFDEVSALHNFDLLAGAFPSQGATLEFGTRQVPLDGLPYAVREVETLAETVPSSSVRLDEQFNGDIIYEMNSYDVVHLATHAEFVSGRPKDSYIAFGKGEFATLEDVRDWDLSNVALIVLSACETGVGDTLGNGIEVLGLGYQMQQQGADATLATLWSVSDRSTQLLMNRFYENLLDGGRTKTVALQESQRAMLTNDKFNHPYYWASFILIGNGL
ncbi:Tetratricopeptide TPR_1 repeat-containing protein [[Leptolyngbya] sp. PCC 7376]|nr:Tetratricopeptide TPR_1 repeat-containing protein [[Leptolyngbya] sp. PCC 7376]